MGHGQMGHSFEWVKWVMCQMGQWVMGHGL